MLNATQSAPGTHATLSRVVEICHRAFVDRPEPRAFLTGLGIPETRLGDTFQLGFADGSLSRTLPHQGPVRNRLVELGVLDAEGGERFAGRLVVPIWDAGGQLVNLWGLALEAGGTPAGLPDRPLGVWNLGAVKAHSRVVVTEDVLDAWAATASGNGNVVAVPGPIPDELPEAMRVCGVLQVTVLGVDEARARARIEALKVRGPGRVCRWRLLARPLHDLLRTEGPEALKEWLAADPGGGARPEIPVGSTPSGFSVRLSARRYEVRGLEKGPRCLKATVQVEQAGREHVDTLDLYSARCRREFCQDLARVFEESAGVIETEVVRLVGICDARGLDLTAKPEPRPPELGTDARQAAQAFGRQTDLVEAILQDFDRCGLVGERANKLLCYLAMTSRKLDRPLAVLIQSSSGAGKTALQDAALRFCPPEDLVKVASLSARALFYKNPEELRHKVLAIEEDEGVQRSAYALRTLISSGGLSAQVTARDGGAGRFITVTRHVEGPVAVFLTTTEPEVDPETRSRFWVTSVDEGREQTRAILAHQRQGHTLEGLARLATVEAVAQRHWDLQRLLQPLPVVNPYADQLSFGDGRLQNRRTQPRYLDLIGAIALLRQMQKPLWRREVAGRLIDYIEADLVDIGLANELTAELLGHTLDELSGPAFDLLMQLERLGPGQTQAFTRQEACALTGWGYGRLHRYLRELLRLEFVVPESSRSGSARAYRLLYRGEGKDGSKFSLGLKPVERLQPVCTAFAPGLQGECTEPSHAQGPEVKQIAVGG